MDDLEQRENLKRVSDRIGNAIIAFARQEMGRSAAPMFHMDDLVNYIKWACGQVAPDSPSRVLRMLRQKKKIEYVIVDRSKSLYGLVSVAP